MTNQPTCPTAGAASWWSAISQVKWYYDSNIVHRDLQAFGWRQVGVFRYRLSLAVRQAFQPDKKVRLESLTYDKPTRVPSAGTPGAALPYGLIIGRSA